MFFIVLPLNPEFAITNQTKLLPFHLLYQIFFGLTPFIVLLPQTQNL